MNKIVRFKDLHFDILDDHHEPTEHDTDDLNRYFVSPTMHPIITKEEVVVAMDVDSSGDGDDEDMDEGQEEKLSQQMNELSMKNTKRQISDSLSADQSRKKMKVSEPEQRKEDDDIPTYLMATNPLFEHRLKKLLKGQTSNSIDDLRQMAILKHQLAELSQEKRLFLFYLQAGKGTLKDDPSESNNVNRCVWLNEVITMGKRYGHDQNNADGTVYENMLQSQLQEIDDRLEQDKQQLNSLKEQGVYLTLTFEEAINYIVESDGRKYVRAQYDGQIGLLECD